MTPAFEDLPIPEAVRADIEKIKAALLEQWADNIARVILFGSYATDTWQPDSDIDLAVVLRVLPALCDRPQYKQTVDIKREVDLLFCTQEQLNENKWVYRHINETGVVVYE